MCVWESRKEKQKIQEIMKKDKVMEGRNLRKKNIGKGKRDGKEWVVGGERGQPMGE